MRNGRVARLLVLITLVGLAAGCSSASSSTPPAEGTGSTSTASASSPSQASAQATAAPSFAPIVEPFDPGHPAKARSGPADCTTQTSTLATVLCYEIKTENADVQIDAVQLAKYSRASLASDRAAIQAQDGAWLNARGPVCSAAFKTGGTIDQVNTAICLLAESTARLSAVQNVTAPEAKLKATDSLNPGDESWYTTPEGSRIAEISTQGDQTGGAIVAWVIIGGAAGFTVNPRQFYFQDGSFTDPGVIQGTDPTGHKVATGAMFQFSIDYSHLSQDPNRSRGGGYQYVPGTPAAVWS